MRSRRGDDRGGSAVEAALLMAAIALVMLPALFLLGRAVDSAFGKPCEAEELDNRCAVQRDGGGQDGDAGGSDAGSAAPANLSSRVANEVGSAEVESVDCDSPVTGTPPNQSTTCEVHYTDGRPSETFQVVWTGDTGPVTLTLVQPSS